jgi:SAM-dependent methyltransferase
MNTLEARSKSFDEVADLYDRFRPGYPAALVDDVVRLSEIPAHGRILEIGCGTGKATAPFAARGYRVLGLEPGPHLAAVAERNLAAFPDVRIERCTFEEWPAGEGGFDLVMAAQSFHYIDAPSGLAKAADALRPGGAIAIFANQPPRGEAEVHRRVQQAYARLAPTLHPRDEDTGFAREIDRTGRFETVTTLRYPWNTVYGADAYVGLMATQSDHHLLPPARRAALLEAIRQAILDTGDAIPIEYVTLLHLARRRAAGAQ